MGHSSFNPPGPLSDSGPDARFLGWLNQLRKWCMSLVVRESTDITPSYSWDGIRLLLRDKGGGSGASNWADPILYDNAKTYKKGEEVIILPTSLVVTTGFKDSDTRAIKKSVAGMWKATRDVPLDAAQTETFYHIPQWPLPFDGTPDGQFTYWWPVAFYPATVFDCMDSKNYLMNSQVKPT